MATRLLMSGLLGLVLSSPLRPSVRSSRGLRSALRLVSRQRVAAALSPSPAPAEGLTPPWGLVDSPVYSVATRDLEHKGNMNIATYVSAASLAKDADSKKCYSVALFKNTRTHDNAKRDGEIALQLLSRRHSRLIKLLGKTSGNDGDKMSTLTNLGEEVSWRWDMPYLSSCKAVCRLKSLGWLDAGDHELGLFEVIEWLPGDSHSDTDPDAKVLDTSYLKEIGVL